MKRHFHNISALLFVIGLVLGVASCRDDDFTFSRTPDTSFTRAEDPDPSTLGGLIQQIDGTWKTSNCRVPIVGPGRVVNRIYGSTLSVLQFGNQHLERIVDLDLIEAAEVPATVSATVLYTPILSVRDIYHAYSPGEKVGFIYMDNAANGAKLLTLDVLKGMTITTYLNGEKQESVYAADAGNTLELDLLSFNTGDTVADREIAFKTSKVFDEVEIGLTGVNATAVSNVSLAIKYAFVGDNPEIRATSETEFAPYWPTTPEILDSYKSGIVWHDATNVASASNITDNDISNFAPFVVGSFATVNLHKEISAGTEVGFCYSGKSVLGLGLLGTSSPEVSTYDSSNNLKESSSPSISLLAVSLIGASKKSYASLVTTEPCSQIRFTSPVKLELGGWNVYYAYVREGIKLAPANYFSVGDDVTAENAYRLPQPSVGTVSYTILSHPYGCSPITPSAENGYVMGAMLKDGAYYMEAVYTAEDGRKVTIRFTITRKTEGIQTGCNQYITAKSHGAYATETASAGFSGGSLLSFFVGKNNANNVVDNDVDNFAEYTGVLEVVGKRPVMAIKMNVPVSPSGEKVRAGFVIQPVTGLLDLSAISSYDVRLYNKGTLVESVPEGTGNTVGLGLIDTDHSKVRVYVTTDKEFDQIELWKSGVAGLAEQVRIYNVFYEPVHCAEQTASASCMEFLTDVKDGLEIDYEHTQLPTSLLSVVPGILDMGGILDGKIDTHVSLGNGAVNVDLLNFTGTVISVKFPEMPAGQTIGIVLDNSSNLLDLNLLSGTTFKVFHGETEVAHNIDFSLLGLNLISRDGHIYMELTPATAYDRIEFSAGGALLGANLGPGSGQPCALYVRRDSDGDGIPDCADNTDTFKKLDFQPGPFHACNGDLRMFLNATPADGMTNYYIYAYNTTTREFISTAATRSGTVVSISDRLPVGEYLIYVYTEDGAQCLAYDIPARVHPKETAWKKNVTDVDWDRWDNWTNGVPWSCTDVIIPSGAARYPELSDVSYCHCIHFEPGAEIVNQYLLQVEERVFVDLRIPGGQPKLVGVPLRETYTGDMFINPKVSWGKARYFTKLTQDTYAEQRVVPVIFQRLWSGIAYEKDINLDRTDLGGSEWSDEFNDVSQLYSAGQGFMLRVGSALDFNVYTIRLPKEHTNYSYYYPSGTSTGKSESIARGSDVGKFLVQTQNYTVTLKNNMGNTFLFGNPFMAHIDISALMEGTDIDHFHINGVDVTTGLLAPLEAAFVVTKNTTGTLNINITAEMTCQKNQ